MRSFGPGLSLLRTTLCIAAAALAATSAHTQAVPTATQSMEVSAFGGYLSSRPDYGPYRDNGFAFGANITRLLHFPVSPSLEARAQFAQGTTVNEHMYLFGVRGQSDFYHHRIHPYANFLIGPADLYYNGFTPHNIPGYTHDNGLVKSFGGGADIDITHGFAAKADFQGQFWDLGGTFTLAPTTVLFGVSYRIPFGGRSWQPSR